jgi:tetratricopeptide (TPR) repeat protein
MDRPTALAHLRDILAELYEDEASARRVAADAGLDARRIAIGQRSLDNWHAILQEALHQRRGAALCEVVYKEYPKHGVLQEACVGFLAVAPPPVPSGPMPKACWPAWLFALALLLAIVWAATQLLPSLSSTSVATLPPSTLTPPAVPTATLTAQSSFTPTLVAPVCPPQRLCVLVARFAPEENETASQFTTKIVQEIRTVLDATATERFAVETASPIRDPEAARRLARAAGALLVVWGQVFTALEQEVRVSVNFQVTDLLGVGEAQTTRPYRVQPLLYDPLAGYCTNCFYLEASQRTNVVAYAVAGLVHYVQQRPRQARHDFLAALYCVGVLDKRAAEQILRLVQPMCTPPTTPWPWDPGLLYYYTGKAYYLEGDYQAAKVYLEQAATHNQDDPAAWIALATLWQEWLDRPAAQEAQAALRRAEEKATGLLGQVEPALRAVVYFERGFARELAANVHGAQEDYQAAAEGLTATDESPYVAWIALARAQRMASDPVAARSTLTDAVALAPELPWAYLELALLDQKERTAAERWLQEAAERAPDEASVAMIRARLCKIWQDYACAGEAYAQALKQRRESGLLYLEVGDFYLPSVSPLPHQNLEQAEIYYQKAAQELRPNDPSAHQRLANALSQRQAYSEAIERYRRVIELVSADAEAATYYCDIGHLQKASGLSADARASFQQCVDLASADELRQKAQQWLADLAD